MGLCSSELDPVCEMNFVCTIRVMQDSSLSFCSRMLRIVSAKYLLMNGNRQKVPHALQSGSRLDHFIYFTLVYTDSFVHVGGRRAGVQASGKVTFNLNKRLKLRLDWQKNIHSTLMS